MKIAAKVPAIACIVAFLIAAGAMVTAVSGLAVALPLALIPLVAGIGILRRRIWSAYGFALYLLAQLIPTFLVLARSSTPGEQAGRVTASAAIALILATLFFGTGKLLARSGGVRGRPLPWILTTTVCTVPLLFVQPFVIPTGAMEDTLLIGDRILVQRFPRPSVSRGDLLVFTYPVDRRQVFVKRVIGMPGDRIRIASKTVYRGGAAVTEPYAVHKTDYEDPYRDNFPSKTDAPFVVDSRDMLTKHIVNGEVVVSPGCYFVLGDNRDNSLDSRYWGFVGSEDVIGRPLLIYDSRERSTEGGSGGADCSGGLRDLREAQSHGTADDFDALTAANRISLRSVELDAVEEADVPQCSSFSQDRGCCCAGGVSR